MGPKIVRLNERVVTEELNHKFWLLGVSAPEIPSEGVHGVADYKDKKITAT